MAPWAQAVYDTLGALVSNDVLDEVMDRGMIEVLPLTHIRGRSLHDAFVIVDEAQSLERNVLLTVLSRIGQGSRVVLTHDVAQRDNLRVGRHDGIAAVIEALRGHPLFAHVTLTRSEALPDRRARHRDAGGPADLGQAKGRRLAHRAALIGSMCQTLGGGLWEGGQTAGRVIDSTSSTSSSLASVIVSGTWPRSMTTWRIVLLSASACLAILPASS